MRARELRKKSSAELEIALRELREKMFDINYQHKNKQLDDINLKKRMRKDIARHITILKEKRLQGEE